MQCPNCGQLLEKQTQPVFKSCYRLDEDGFDLEKYYQKFFVHSCKACKIKFTISENGSDGEWTLPNDLAPSAKQVSYAKAIAEKLNKSIDNLVVKRQFWQFINDNVDEYKRICQEETEMQNQFIAEEVAEWCDESLFC